MRFVQLYTSPSFRNQRSKLVTPSEDWEQSHIDVSKHKFSPLVSGLFWPRWTLTAAVHFSLLTFTLRGVKRVW